MLEVRREQVRKSLGRKLHLLEKERQVGGAAEPFEPYGVAAVELADEQMVVLGQLARGTDIASLTLGEEMTLVAEPLFEDDEAVHTVWKWRPVA